MHDTLSTIYIFDAFDQVSLTLFWSELIIDVVLLIMVNHCTTVFPVFIM